MNKYVGDASAMAMNSKLNRAIVATVPVEDRAEFEAYFYNTLEDRIRKQYRTWKFVKRYRANNGHENDG